MKRPFRTVALLLVCVALSSAQEAPRPAGMDVEGLFNLMQARCARTQTTSFTLTQTVSTMEQTMTGEGQGTLKRPGKNYFVTRMSMPMGEMITSIISDGKTMWQTVKMPMGLQVVKFDLSTMDAGAAAQVSGLGPWGTVDADRVQELKKQMMLQFDAQVAGKDTVSGTPVYVVDLKPKGYPWLRVDQTGGALPLQQGDARLRPVPGPARLRGRRRGRPGGQRPGRQGCG